MFYVVVDLLPGQTLAKSESAHLAHRTIHEDLGMDEPPWFPESDEDLELNFDEFERFLVSGPHATRAEAVQSTVAHGIARTAIIVAEADLQGMDYQIYAHSQEDQL